MTSADGEPAVPEPGEAADSPAAGPESGHRKRPFWQELVFLVVGALLLSVLIKVLFIQAFYIPSPSMEPGLVKNDRILVEKPSYWFGGTPQRGDVIVFKDPGGWLDPEEVSQGSNPVTRMLSKIGLYPSGGQLVKRVVGIPGDVVSCCDVQGRILVNGAPVTETAYARPKPSGCQLGTAGVCFGPMPFRNYPGLTSWKSQTVPPGMLFVMGDNRADSADSSDHMCMADEVECAKSPWVPEANVVGKVMAVVWPLGHARFEHRPGSFDAVPAP